MGTVQLVPETIDRGSTRLLRVPRWVRPDDAEGYWHVPRSAELRDADLMPHYRRANIEALVTVHMWCGQVRWVRESAMLAEPYAGARLCGTCDGRARGFERRDGLIYSPRSPFDAPKFCPALLARDEDLCPFCGSKPRYRRNYCHYDQAQHRPGEGFAAAEPCPLHGWKYAHRQGDKIVCFGTPWRVECGHEIMRIPA